MRVKVPYEKLFGRSSTFFATAIRVLLNVLLVIIFCALAIGVVKAGYDLFTSIHQPLNEILQQVLLDIVFIVALVEITLTLLGYLKDGHVHVRYIVDTILIIMLNEVVTIWFKKASLEDAIGLGIILTVIAGVRITTIRYTADGDVNDGTRKPKLAKD